MYAPRASLQLRPEGKEPQQPWFLPTFPSWARGREKVQSHGARLMSNLG